MLNEPSDVTSEFTVVKGGNRRRLLWRISVRVLPLAFAMVVVAQVFIGYLNYTENFNQLQTRVDLLAHLQSRALQLPMWNMDSQLIDTMIRALEQDPDFISAKVLDARGEVAFKNERERNPGNRPVSASASIVFSDSQQSRQLGELQISLSSETLDQTLFRQILAILAAALILIIGYSAALFSALNATVFKPLDLLLGGMAEVGRHRWVTVQWPALDEIGELVGAFNHMVAGLRAGEDARQALRDREERYAIAVADEARADAANRAKSEFLAKMSHELRTPLNAIGNYCLLIKEELADLGQSHLMDDLGNIESSSRHLLSIINDVLDLSKIEAGYMELLYEKVDVAEFIRETRLMSISLSERNRNSFVLDMQDDLGEMVTDSTRLRQSILNLISNAVKFTSDGTVTLKVRADESWVIISLSDTGIGMTQAQIGRIFEPFIQADASTTKRFGGTGLGLALTRTFVTMLGGAIDVTSEYGKGSTFRIMLPRDSANQQLPTVPSGQKQVLVLASEDAPITEFARALKADGHKVIQVVTAAALERAVLESKPDLIVAKINNDSFDASKLRDFIRPSSSSSFLVFGFPVGIIIFCLSTLFPRVKSAGGESNPYKSACYNCCRFVF